MLNRHLATVLLAAAVIAAAAGGCRDEVAPTTHPATAATPAADPFARRRDEMVREQLAGRDITDERVLDAMRRVPRHRFVMEGFEGRAYDDSPLPIRQGQTISQPYIVALMTQLAGVKPGDRVLDVGTGSGYQAAVLAEMGAEVSSIEIVPELAEEARARLKELKYDRVEVRAGDGYRGWPERAPFKAIILAAAAPQVPKPLVEQLATGGKLIIPVGPEGGLQELLVVTKQADGSVKQEKIASVAFVPMTGEIRDRAAPRR